MTRSTPFSGSRRHPRAGITLLEVMIVLAIMALIIGVAAPRFLDSLGRAKSQTAAVAMANLKGALQMFYIDVGRHPSEAEGLDALVRQPSGAPGWQGPYLDEASGIVDPWGRRYVYRSPGNDGKPFNIQTYGRDGRPGGTREDTDITS